MTDVRFQCSVAVMGSQRNLDHTYVHTYIHNMMCVYIYTDVYNVYVYVFVYVCVYTCGKQDAFLMAAYMKFLNKNPEARKSCEVWGGGLRP